MNTTILKTENRTVLLNKNQTKEFLQRIDNAICLFDHIEIIKVIIDFKFKITPDIRQFLDQANEVTKVSEKYETVVKQVTHYQTKCIACSFGKTVNGYEIKSAVKDCQNIIFTTKTALYLEIVEGELLDFGWCNGFLSREEINEINDF